MIVHTKIDEASIFVPLLAVSAMVFGLLANYMEKEKEDDIAIDEINLSLELENVHD